MDFKCSYKEPQGGHRAYTAPIYLHIGGIKDTKVWGLKFFGGGVIH